MSIVVNLLARFIFATKLTGYAGNLDDYIVFIGFPIHAMKLIVEGYGFTHGLMFLILHIDIS